MSSYLDTIPAHLLATSGYLLARAENTTLPAVGTVSNSTTSCTTTCQALSVASRPSYYKIIGLSLAIASGAFIGTSFVLKKVGLLAANEKYNEEAGEGYGYLKNPYWWGGMTLMILGELCNFVAYAFTDAILVTPLGALSVVITTILSAIFLKERLSFVGKIGCFLCILGSVVIVLNAPEQSAVADIQEMQHFVIAPGFLTYAGVIIAGSIFIALWLGPRYGKKSMFVYLSVCSFIGGLSVVATQGLGAAVVAQANTGGQFKQWFLYVLFVFVVGTLLTEIVYLNKALNLFNAALVTPTYYVFFTSTTIITSAILFRGFHGTAVTITTVVLGFFTICSGVVLLQLSKSAKDVPDAAVFKGDLDQVREVANQEQSELEPKADAIRGTAAIIRRLSTPRRNLEQMEAKRLREEKQAEHLEPLRENEVAEWDGLRRRKTVIGSGPSTSPAVRRKTVHPPLGMSHFPDASADDEDFRVFPHTRDRVNSLLHRQPRSQTLPAIGSPTEPVQLTSINFKSADGASPALPYGPGSFEEAQHHIYGHYLDRNGKPMPSPRSKPLPQSPAPSSAGLHAPANEAKRQFSFSNFLRQSRMSTRSADSSGIIRPTTADSHAEKKARKNATEEERLGLVKGDSTRALLSATDTPEADRSTNKTHSPLQRITSTSLEPLRETPSLENTYPFTHGSRQRRTGSPDAMDRYDDLSDDEPLPAAKPGYSRVGHEPFSFTSSDPNYDRSRIIPTASIQTPSPQKRETRKRPSPPAIYTGPGSQSTPTTFTRDFTDSRPQLQTRISDQATRRVTIGQDPDIPSVPGSSAAAASTQPSQSTVPRKQAPSLEPPVQFKPSSSQTSKEVSPHSDARAATVDEAQRAELEAASVPVPFSAPPAPPSHQSRFQPQARSQLSNIDTSSSESIMNRGRPVSMQIQPSLQPQTQPQAQLQGPFSAGAMSMPTHNLPTPLTTTSRSSPERGAQSGDEPLSSSRERFVEQSARERDERRARAERRKSGL